MDEDLIVLGGPAETQAVSAETSEAVDASIPGQPAEGDAAAATPGKDPAEPAAPAPKADAEDDGGEEKPQKRSGLTRMRERNARLEAELAELRSRSQPVGDSGDRKAAIEKEIGAAPKEADFEDYVSYEDAKADYRIRKALAEQRVTEREAQSSTRQAQAREAAVEAFQDRMDEAREKIADFDTVVKGAATREVKPHVQELVIDSEKGGLLAYYLAKHPAELAKLNGMSAIQAAKAVGALETRLTLAKPNRTPSAPAPAKPVTGAAATGPDPSKMSFAEYEKWRAGKRG